MKSKIRPGSRSAARRDAARHHSESMAMALAGDLPPLAMAVLLRLAGDRRVAVPVARIAAAVSDHPDLPMGCDVRPAVDDAVAAVVAAGLAESWHVEPGTPSAWGIVGRVLTRSLTLAGATGVRLNDEATAWVPIAHRARSAQLGPRQDDPGREKFTLLVSEADLLPEDGFTDVNLAADPDGRTPSDLVSAAEQVAILARESPRPWRRPEALLGTGMAWPADERGPDGGPRPGGFVQDRWPYLDSPVHRNDRGEPRRADASAACPACSGGPALLAACLVCGATGQDARLTPADRRMVGHSAEADRRNVRRGTVPNAATVPPHVPDEADGLLRAMADQPMLPGLAAAAVGPRKPGRPRKVGRPKGNRKKVAAAGA